MSNNTKTPTTTAAKPPTTQSTTAPAKADAVEFQPLTQSDADAPRLGPLLAGQLPLRSWHEARALAGYVAQAGYFPEVKTAAQALVKIGLGAELGIGPIAAVRGVIVNDRGTIELSANLQAALVRRSNRYDFKVVKHDETICSIEFYRIKPAWIGSDAWELIGTSTLTIQQAHASGMTMQFSKGQRSEKITWKNYPRNMLFARAMSNGVKWFAPDVLNGLTVYDPDELLDSQDVINVTPTAATSQALPPADTSTAAPAQTQTAQQDAPSDDQTAATTTTTTQQDPPPPPPEPPQSAPVVDSSSSEGDYSNYTQPEARRIWAGWMTKSVTAKKDFPEKAKAIESVVNVNKPPADAPAMTVLNAAYLIMQKVCEVTGELEDAKLTKTIKH